MRWALADLLYEEGYQVATVANGSEAFEWLNANTCDLILLDLMMPILDGWEFIKRKCALPALDDIPVVVHSVHGAPDEVICGYVKKPSDLNCLFESVDRCLREYGKHLR